MIKASASFFTAATASSTENTISQRSNFSSELSVITIFRRLGSAPLGSESNVFLPIITGYPVVICLTVLNRWADETTNRCFSRWQSSCCHCHNDGDIFICHSEFLLNFDVLDCTQFPEYADAPDIQPAQNRAYLKSKCFLPPDLFS